MLNHPSRWRSACATDLHVIHQATGHCAACCSSVSAFTQRLSRRPRMPGSIAAKTAATRCSIHSFAARAETPRQQLSQPNTASSQFRHCRRKKPQRWLRWNGRCGRVELPRSDPAQSRCSSSDGRPQTLRSCAPPPSRVSSVSGSANEKVTVPRKYAGWIENSACSRCRKKPTAEPYPQMRWVIIPHPGKFRSIH